MASKRWDVRFSTVVFLDIFEPLPLEFSPRFIRGDAVCLEESVAFIRRQCDSWSQLNAAGFTVWMPAVVDREIARLAFVGGHSVLLKRFEVPAWFLPCGA
jgi:hypothetical protein